MLPDEELVHRTFSEGSHYFGELVRRHGDYLFGLGMRLTSGNRQLSEDISQQAFMKAYANLKSFNTKKIFRYWLTGIAVNCFKDFMETENRYASNEHHDEDTYIPDFDGESDFFTLIRPLTKEETIIFTLRFVYDYQVEEIANFLEIKAGTIKSKLSRAMEKLR